MRALPESWFSNTFTLQEDGGDAGRLRTSGWREKAELDVGRRTYRLYRERLFGGPFLLTMDHDVVARAVKPSFLFNTFELDVAGKTFVMEKESMWRRAFVVSDGTAEVGSIRPEGIITGRTAVSLPTDWPLPVRAFVFWLALVVWRRQRAAASSSGG